MTFGEYIGLQNGHANFERGLIALKLFLPGQVMAASPIQVDIKQEEQTWSRPDENSANVVAPPPTNGDAPPPSNGATQPHPDDQRDVQQPVEAVKHERTGSSVPDTTSTSTAKQDSSQRGEKQIKVLVKSYFLITVTPVFILSWHKHPSRFNAQSTSLASL